MNHGHVTPNADGSRARCGEPGLCPECSAEWATKFPPRKYSEATIAYMDKLFPCEKPCDSYGVCEGCCERTTFLAGYCMAVKDHTAALDRANEKLAKCKEALNSMIAYSHSWMISVESAHHVAPIMDEIRKRAHNCLTEISDENGG